MVGTSRDARRAQTAQKILQAAQDEFALHGFYGSTIRGIADRAGVHASLVMQHYGSKAQLFEAAAHLPGPEGGTAGEHLADVLNIRMEGLPPEMLTLVRSMLTVPEAEARMREYLDERVDNLRASIDGPDAEVRAAVVVSSILGLTIARHLLKLTAFDGMDLDALVRVASEQLTRTATPPAD